MTRIPLTLGLATLALVAGCASHSQYATTPLQRGATPSRATVTELRVEVRNQHWLPVQVWAEWPELRQFLGDVSPGSSTVFHLGSSLVAQHGSFRLFADPSGSADQVLTDPIECPMGRGVEFTVHRVLASSRARVM